MPSEPLSAHGAHAGLGQPAASPVSARSGAVPCPSMSDIENETPQPAEEITLEPGIPPAHPKDALAEAEAARTAAEAQEA